MSRKKRGDDDNGFEEWGGYMGAKMQKLQQQFRADAAKSNPYRKSNLFAGVSIHVNGLTDPSADELKRIMMTHGGVYDTYHRPGATTFVVAQNLPDVKIRALFKSKSRLIIGPGWIVDCVREMRLLDYSRYLLYTNERTDQPTIGFKRAVVVDEEEDLQDMAKKEFSVKDEELINTRKAFESFVAEDEDEDMFADDDDPPSGDSNPKVEPPNAPLENPELASILLDLHVLNEQLRQCNRDPDPSSIVTTLISPPESQVLQPDSKRSAPKQALTAVDPNFLVEFYNNSRLHHIATLGAGFKSHIAALREASTDSFPGRPEMCRKFASSASGIKSTEPAAIMHIDMDCFFVSVGLRDRPHLRGQPVAVTHSKGGGARTAVRPGADPERERAMYEARRRGSTAENRMETKTREMTVEATDSLAEIASCSYEARRAGVKNGMFVGAALKLCPTLKTIPYDFEQYKEVAHSLYNTVAKYTLDIEAVSCDEMYVDLESVLRTTGVSAQQFVTHLRAEIRALTGCPCSAGIGANRLQARMATKQAKPDGQFFLAANEVEEYFGAIAVADLPGVGYSTTQKLNQLGWQLCADLRDIPLTQLQTVLGKKLGETLQKYCRGVDNKPLIFGQIRKSVSAEVNYGIRFARESEFDAFLDQLCAEVHSRLAEIRQRGKAITLKLMVRSADAPVETAKFMGHGVCDNVTKTSTLTEASGEADVIRRTVFALKKSMAVDARELRGVGIQIGKLDGEGGGERPAAAGRLKAMFEVAAKKKEDAIARKVEPDEGFQEIQPLKRVLRTQRQSEPKKEPVSVPIVKAKRGRKRGSTSASTSRAIGQGTTKQPSLTDLLAGTANQSIAVDSSNPDSELDMAVLAELPDNIREEALRDFRLQHQTAKRQKVIKPDPVATTSECTDNEFDADFLAALPADIRAELLRDQALRKQREVRKQQETAKICEEAPTKAEEERCEADPVDEAKPLTSEGNVFASADWRRMLHDWLNSSADSDGPLPSDIETIAEYAAELARLRMINDLYLRFRYLFRIIAEKGQCTWHRAYHQIVDVMQQAMMQTYRAKLQVQCIFNCAHCDQM